MLDNMLLDDENVNIQGTSHDNGTDPSVSICVDDNNAKDIKDIQINSPHLKEENQSPNKGPDVQNQP